MKMHVLVNIDVPELHAAIAFYEAAVGVKLKRLLDGDVAELEYGSSLLYLLCKPAKSQATLTPLSTLNPQPSTPTSPTERRHCCP